MRKTKLLSATALSLGLSGLAAVILAAPAFADTSIATATTTPVVTSSAGNVTVTSAGTITLTTGTAITVDSDNTVTLTGPIAMSSSTDNSTGILISGGHTSTLTIASSITVTDDYTATDTTSPVDGFVDAPFATGTGRYGVHSMGTTPFVGNVIVASGSTIQVEGNNSYGIRFENNINGTFSYLGATTMLGTGNTGISLENGVTGNVLLGGSITHVGGGSGAINLNGNFGGNILIEGTYTGTGYASTSGLTDTQIAALSTADLAQAAPLVSISGNVANGILLEAVPTAVSTSTSVDQDGDGQTDTTESTASLSQYGSAPALRIGSATSDITIGALTYNSSAVAPPAISYGLLVRGGITAAGVYSGVTSTAIQLGGLGHAVNIANGVGIVGTVSASSRDADSTGLAVLAGTSTPVLSIDAGGSLRGATSTISGTTGYGVDIAVGANLPTLTINAGGAIYGVDSGSKGNATAIRDRSNTLTTLNNNNIISATISASDDDGDGVTDTVVNRAVAIDTHTNTVGLNLTQTDTALTDDTIAAPSITGDILLGSGNDNIVSSGGVIVGNIDFGGGANSYTLTNGASYFGKMTGAGTVALDVSDGAMALTVGTSLNLTSLHMGAQGVVAFTVNTAAPTTPIFNVSGPVVLDNGALIGITLNNILRTPQSFTLLNAGSINLGTLNTADLSGNIPYLYMATLTTNSTNTALFANFRLRTQAEAGYSNNEYSALDAVLTAVAQEPTASATLLAQTTKAGFDSVYEQYLPDYSGETLITLSKSVEALDHTLGSLTLIPDNNDGQYWLQEYGTKTTRKYGDTAGFDSTGFSFAGGREQVVGGHSMLGVYMSYTSATPLDTFAIAKEQLVTSDLTIGGYWRMRDEGFKAWLHAGAGYTQFDSTRELLNANLTHIATAKWSGYSYSAGGGASYDYKLGPVAITPQVSASYYHLNEAKHTEAGGGDFFDLTTQQRNGSLLTSSALLDFSYTKMFVKPEIWVGYKQNLTGDIANTVSNFSGGTQFTLTGGNIKGGGPVAGVRFSADNEYSYFSLEADYEKLDAYTNYSLSLRTRFQF